MCCLSLNLQYFGENKSTLEAEGYRLLFKYPNHVHLLCTRAGKIKPKNLQVWFLSVFVRKTNIWGWIWMKSGMLSFIYHNRNLFSRFSSWGCWGRPLSTAFTVWRKTIAESKQKVQPPAAIIKIVTAKPCKQCLCLWEILQKRFFPVFTSWWEHPEKRNWVPCRKSKGPISFYVETIEKQKREAVFAVQ